MVVNISGNLYNVDNITATLETHTLVTYIAFVVKATNVNVFRVPGCVCVCVRKIIT